MATHQEVIEEFIQKVNKRHTTYGQVLLKSAIWKREGIWKNLVTKILPLPFSDTYTCRPKLDYGDFALLEKIITINELIEIVAKLPEKGSVHVNFEGYDVQADGTSIEKGYNYDSGAGNIEVGWLFETYQYSSQNRNFPPEPLISPNLPLFPDSRTAIERFIGIDFSHYSYPFGIIICLPNYGARIEEVSIGSKEIKVKIQPKAENAKNIIGKLFCQKDRETKQADIEFEKDTGIVPIGFFPDSLYLVLVSKTTGETLDSRRFYSTWELPKGFVFEVPEYELLEIIRRGETETTEFKEKIGKAEELAETAVAFANGQGGVILIGIDDHANIVGLTQGDNEDTITNILRSHCEPHVKCEIRKQEIEGKTIMLIRVEKGENKPYTVREKGVYVRANATDRIASRYELDEFYKEARSPFKTS